MLTLLIRNNKIIQGTGMSFAVLGTTIHMLNVVNIVSPSVSHTWSAIAIIGFVLTMSNQVGKGMLQRMHANLVKSKVRTAVASKGAPYIEKARNDVVLP